MDLYVRASNAVAINFYKSLGYTIKFCCKTHVGAALVELISFLDPLVSGYMIYKQIIGYYSGEEDAYGISFARLVYVDDDCL